MRADFVLTHGDKSKTVLEVKTVVDTDYDAQLHQVFMFIFIVVWSFFLNDGNFWKSEDQETEGVSKKKKPKKDKTTVVKYLSHAKPYKVRTVALTLQASKFRLPN